MKTIVALMHGEGEIEILVPILKELRMEYGVVIDAPRSCEDAICREIGGAQSLCGGRDTKDRDRRLERQPTLCRRVASCEPQAIVSGLHSNDQKLIFDDATLRPRCIGLVEMSLPSARHELDQPGSKIGENWARCERFLVPSALEPALKRRLKSEGAARKRTVPYGDPVPWNRWVEKGGLQWRIQGDGRGLEKESTQSVVFFGQAHCGNEAVLSGIARRLCGNEIVHVRHPRDDPGKRGKPPENCREVPSDDWPTKLQVVRDAGLVLTEYSNVGYSVALSGRRVHYLFKDRRPGRRLVHLAPVLGRIGRLPVSHSRPESIGCSELDMARVTPSWPELRVERLVEEIESLRR
ncbi:MAG TPA: hypothetical protein VNB06_06240 [Thermoanaerobaculia bacterium]|nr:hypothetical protein [Thermoanaerobaculia bacterium]